jgi:ornithine cyclodeaminase
MVSLFPGNAGKGKQPLFGLVVLNDGATGEPLAIIDGAKLTAMRTAAVGSVAVRHLSPPDVSRLGIIGMGIQGIHQALFACSQRNISTIHILDATPGTYKMFIDTLNKEYPGIEIIIADNSTHLCHESEVIITATNSKVPVIPSDKNSIRNKTIIGVGSYKPDMREFPDEVYPLAGTIYIDTPHGLKESGDLMYPIENKILGEDKFISIERAIREPVERRSTNVFKSVGMALFDLFGAVLVYEKQQKSAI